MLKTIEEIKRANEDSGGHWFEKAAMRFFRTSIAQTVYPAPRGAVFVTGEKDGDNTRRYSVRYCTDAGRIRTVGGFRQYPTLDEALRGARDVAAEIIANPLNLKGGWWGAGDILEIAQEAMTGGDYAQALLCAAELDVRGWGGGAEEIRQAIPAQYRGNRS